MSSLNYSDFCRLCLVKERVSTPIFDGDGDVRRLFLKIATCLPIKVSREDHLPKSICDDCVYKVENQYQFWNTTANSEKQLHQWLGSTASDPLDVKNIHTSGMLTDQLDMKQESMDMDQGSELSKSLSRVEAVLAEEAGRAAAAARGEEDEEEEEESEEEGSNSEESEDDDNDADEPSKDDGESDDAYDEELEPTTFVNVSLACDEAGPSGTQQQTSVAPSTSTSAPAASGSGKRKRPTTQRHNISTRKSTTKGKPTNVKSVAASSNLAAVPSANKTPLPRIERERANLQLKETFKLPIDHLIEATVAHVDASAASSTKSSGRINMPVDTLLKGTARQQDNPTARPSPIDNLIEATVAGMKPIRGLKNIIHSSLTVIDADGQSRVIKSNKCMTDVHGSSVNAPIAHDSRLTITINNDLFAESSVIYSSHDDATENGSTAGLFTASEGLLFSAMHAADGDIVESLCVPQDEEKKYVVVYQEPKEEPVESNRPTCEYCGKMFQSFSRLDRHLVTHSEDRPYPCSHCNKSFKRLHELKVHLKTHTKDKKYVCEICGHSFTQNHHLAVHRRRHLGDFKYHCEVCSKGFHSKDELNSHKNTQHGMNQFVCETCGRSCANKQNFKKHLLLHEPDILYQKKEQCQECGKFFANKSTLRLHAMSHTGENKFPCELCGKTLLSRDSLRTHKTIHTGEKPFVCDVCGKLFRVRENLRVHMRTHTGEKPYPCPECTRAFGQNAALVVHMRYHTGERPFKCDLCEKAYVTKTFLTQHLVTHRAYGRVDIKRECLDIKRECLDTDSKSSLDPEINAS